jgi:iron complex transport system ATP-binding protein
MIEIKNLNIGYPLKNNIKTIFKNISFQINKGELVGLVGDNGVGKSTLIKTITGALLPVSGEIKILDKNVNEYTTHELAKIMSIVVTDKISGFNLTTWDVVASGRIPFINVFGKLTKNDVDIINNCFNQLNITHLKNQLIDELSDGQRQKVMVAKSLAQQSDIIILDEPTAFLDYKSKHQLFDTLKKLCEEKNKLVLVSSHDIDLMKKYTHRTIEMMDDGEIE